MSQAADLKNITHYYEIFNRLIDKSVFTLGTAPALDPRRRRGRQLILSMQRRNHPRPRPRRATTEMQSY